MDIAIKSKGYVFPNLRDAQFKRVDIPYHTFMGKTRKNTITNARDFATSLKGVQKGTIDGREVELTFSDKAVGKLVSDAALKKSTYTGGHLAVVENIFKVLEGSVDTEIHPNIYKRNNVREWENGFDKSILCHRYYAYVSVGGDIYRVMTLVNERRPDAKIHTISPYAVEVEAFEIEKIESPEVPADSHKGIATKWEDASDSSISGTKLLKGIEKSYDKGKKHLDEITTVY